MELNMAGKAKDLKLSEAIELVEQGFAVRHKDWQWACLVKSSEGRLALSVRGVKNKVRGVRAIAALQSELFRSLIAEGWSGEGWEIVDLRDERSEEGNE
jgi:hypothetical protein